MPDGSGATVLEDLPEEIIDNILVRLPSRDVGRCRAVSASWRSATSTPDFMLRHHRRQPSLPIIDGGRGVLLLVGAGASGNQNLWPFLPGAKNRYKIRLRGACDGFLAVAWISQFYVCNPVTREHALLPQPHQLYQDMIGFAELMENNIVGFYRHHPTGEHRVLWASQQSHEFVLHIQTVGCDTPPRHVVGVRLPTTSSSSSPSMEHNTLLECLFCSKHFPVVDHGNLHWHPHVTGVDGQLLVFDTEAESFRWMRYPAAQLTCNLKLFSMKGRLALSGTSRYDHTIADVWVMQDYKAETWVFSCRIDLSVVVEASRQLHLTPFEKEEETWFYSTVLQRFYGMVALNDRELLMSNAKHVLRCDVNGSFLGMVHMGQLTQLYLQESIIPIPCHGMQGEDEEEPFSINHI